MQHRKTENFKNPIWGSLVLAFAGLCFSAIAASACGWWGDGEMKRHDIPVLRSPEGQVLDPGLNGQTTKLPNRMGYGIAVIEPGYAIPYLQATSGRLVNRIEELKTYGFVTVIDLGGGPGITEKHQKETEAIGMGYVGIPIIGELPSRRQAMLFRETLLDPKARPLLVYAPELPVLGALWASYRLSFGSPESAAFSEGRALGLTPEQEVGLRALKLH